MTSELVSEPVFRLMYRSRSLIPSADRKVELGVLFSGARSFNKSQGITGALLTSGDWFVQILEGDQARVQALYERISADPRHDTITMLAAGDAHGQVFARWAMARVAENGETDIPLIRHQDGIAPAASRPSTPDQEALLSVMRAAVREEPTAEVIQAAVLKPAGEAASGREGFPEGPGMHLPGPLLGARAAKDPLARLLYDVAHRKPTPVNGTVEVFPAPAGPCDAVVAFTGHAAVAADVPESWVRDHLSGGGSGGHPQEALSVSFLGALSDRLGAPPAAVSVLLTAPRPSGPTPMVELRDSEHQDADWAADRTEVRCYEDEGGDGVLNLGLGPGGRWDVWMGFVGASRPVMSPRGLGKGRVLLETARAHAPDVLFASVPSSNARALRAFEAGGFRAIGAEVLFRTRPGR